MGGCGSDACGSCVCAGAQRRNRPATVVDEPFASGGAETITVGALIREVAGMLAAAGVPSPAADARQLAGHVLGLAPTALATAPTITVEARGAVLAAAGRRAAREPLQHITGEAAFRYLDLHVGPGVFVPRPETEVVVQAALDLLPADGPAVIVDLGAGSGAIAVSLATERPSTTAYAVELDAGAVPWLTQNVIRHAASLRSSGSTIRVVLGDAGAVSRTGQPLEGIAGRVDLVVSNPPYIPDGLQPRDPEVRDFDPPLALYGGADGLDAVRRWLDTAADLLRPGGHLVMEHADIQGGDDGLPGLVARHEDLATGGPVWADVGDHVDLAGRSRYTVARRTGA